MGESRTNRPSQRNTSSSSNTAITNVVQQLQAYPTDVTKFEAIMKFIDEALQKRQDHSKSDAKVSSLIQGYAETTLNGISGLCQKKDGTQGKLELQKMLIDAFGALGSVHWITAAFSVVAFVLDGIDKTRENKQSCLDLLDDVRWLGHHLVKLYQRIPNESRIIWEAGSVIVEVAIFCIKQLGAKFWRRFAFVKVTTGHISRYKEVIRKLRDNLILTVILDENTPRSNPIKSDEDTPRSNPIESDEDTPWSNLMWNLVPGIVVSFGGMVLTKAIYELGRSISRYYAPEDGSGQDNSERAREES